MKLIKFCFINSVNVIDEILCAFSTNKDYSQFIRTFQNIILVIQNQRSTQSNKEAIFQSYFFVGTKKNKSKILKLIEIFLN